MSKRLITLEEMREIQLNILDSVHAFCMERGLRYSLGGGTLLGAVRHKGYIPWDDDIDIMLPRPDYERFLREYPGTHEHYALQNARLDPACYLMFTKIYDDRTIQEEDIRLRNGVAIDVFPIDGLPAPEEIPVYIKALDKSYQALICTTRMFGFRGISLLRYYLRKLKYPSRKENIRRIKEQLSSYDFETSTYAGAICGSYGEKELMPQSTFTTYLTLPFEGREYKAIADYDAYLTKHYGDYMQLPPKEKQVRGHFFQAWWK